MTKFQKLSLLGGLGVFLATMNLPAQVLTTPTAPREGTRVERVIAPEKPAPLDIGPSLNVRPVRPEQNSLDALTKDRFTSFEKKREEYLKKIEALEKAARGASEADRAKIRERINEFRRELLERARAIREEANDRKRELLERLPKHREVLDQARDNAREQLNSTRKRRGED
jgi:hypothetical protein